VGFYRDRGRTPQALLRLKRVQGTFATNPEYWAVLATLQLSTGDPQAAVASLNRRVELEPEEAAAHLQLANAYAAAGDEAGFEAALIEGLELDPEDAAAGRLVSYFLDEAADDDARAERIERIRSVAPDRPEVVLADAAEALRQQRVTTAEAQLRSAQERFPEDRRFPLQLAQVQVNLSQPDDAIETLEKAVERMPRDTGLRMVLAELQLVRGQAEAGRATLAQAVELAPRNAQARNNLAWLLRKDDPELALAHARQAVELSERQQPAFLDTLGLILLESGDAQGAQAALLDAVSMAPTNPTFQYHYALALERGGSPDRARRVVLQLLSEQRAFPERAEAEALAERLR
jgi:predicted Zn-dependent protease